MISCQYLKVIDYLLLFVSTADTDYLPITDSLLDYLYVTMTDKKQIPPTSVLSQVSYIFKSLNEVFSDG